LNLSQDAVVDHHHSQEEDNHAEEEAQRLDVGFDKQARADQRADEDSDHHGSGERGIDVAAAQINASTGGGGNSYHEIAGGGGDLERDAHDVVHGQHLDGSRANAEQAGKDARTDHGGEAAGDIFNRVRLLFAIRAGECAVHFEAVRPTIGGDFAIAMFAG